LPSPHHKNPIASNPFFLRSAAPPSLAATRWTSQ
jgi:hypothetical protein